MRSRRFAPESLLVLLTCCTVGISCGTNDNRLNTKKGEKILSQWLEKQSIPAENIECPHDIEMAEGTSFTCRATIANADGLVIDITVHQTSNTGDIRLEHASKILKADVVERAVAGRILDESKKKVVVDCGARAWLAAPDTTFLCTAVERTVGANRAVAKAETMNFQITIKDAEGTWQAQRL